MEIEPFLLGLNKYELKTYEALVKLGKSSASKISQVSGVPYGRIYDTLASLVQKGLVKIVPGLTKKYIPTEPKNLIELINKKKDKLNNFKEKMNELQQIYKFREREIVELAEGRKGFHRIARGMKLPNKTLYTIRSLTSYKPEWVAATKNALKRGVDIKNIVDEKRGNKANIKKWKKILPDLRRTDTKGVAISIIDNEEVMLGLINSNITLLIRDSSFAKLMKKFFLNTYNKSKKIKEDF